MRTIHCSRIQKKTPIRYIKGGRQQLTPFAKGAKTIFALPFTFRAQEYQTTNLDEKEAGDRALIEHHNAIRLSRDYALHRHSVSDCLSEIRNASEATWVVIAIKSTRHSIHQIHGRSR